jgi:hypothetical protein
MCRKLDRLHENLRRALEEAPLHSTLGRWMARHREELEALFREGEPDWATMAEAFGKAGLRDESDRRPTAESTAHTWRMVRAAAAAPSPDAQPKWRGHPAGQRRPRAGA